MSEPRQLLTIDQVRTRLGGVSRAFLYEQMNAGLLRPVHLGVLVRFDNLEVDRYIEWLTTRENRKEVRCSVCNTLIPGAKRARTMRYCSLRCKARAARERSLQVVA